MNFKNSNRDGVFRSSEARDEDFYTSLRQDVVQTSREREDMVQASQEIKKSPMRRPNTHDEYTNFVNIADGARETKNALQDWKTKIVYLEEDLKNQNQAMQVVLKQNEQLESKIAKFTRKEKMDQFSLEIPGAPSMHLVEENNALELEIKRLRLHQSGHVAGNAADQLVMAERSRMMRKEKQLEESLAIAKEKNEKLLEELNSKTMEIGDRSSSEGQAMLERNQSRRKEAQLETSLAAAQTENRALLEEIRRHSLEFEKMERLRAQQGGEMRTLRSELDTNRRIVHTKRDILRKEMTDESMEQLRNDTEDRLRVELTIKITEELETRFSAEKDKELREMREGDEEKVRNVECQIPILENEIDRLRKVLSLSKQSHDRAIASIEARYQTKLEVMVENFSTNRKREGAEYYKRNETLSAELEKTKERAAIEKEQHGSQVREEVKAEMQKEVQFLATRVTELTTELIEVVEKMKEEKESFGDSIRDQLIKERDEELAKAAEEKELEVEKVLQELIEERNQEITKIRSELESVIVERESLLNTIETDKAEKEQSTIMRKELEDCTEKLKERENERDLLQQRLEEVGTDLRSTKENYGKDVEELYNGRLEVQSFKAENKKLRNQREELIIMAEEFKNDCINMSNEIKKIKSNFKFAVLVEYEEKIIELENELQRLEGVVAESKAFSSADTKKISQQSLQLERYRAKEQDLESEVKRLKKELMSSVSDVESKESRVTELTGVVQKKEFEAYKLSESAKDLQRMLNDSEKELAKARNEQELTNQRIISTEVYRGKIASLNKELTKQKSRLEHCRCDSNASDKADSGQAKNSAPQKDSKHLEERVQRLNVMLRAAEKNQKKENLNFEATKDNLEKNLLASKDEIKGLHSEVARLKKVSDRSRKPLVREGWRDQSTPDGKTPRMKNSQQNVERMQQQNQALHSIETDFVRYRSKSENTIQNLKNELSLRSEENRKVAQELQESQLLFRDAVMSWRVETRTLKTQLDHGRHSEISDLVYNRMILQNLPDGDSELSDDSPESQSHELQIIKEENGIGEQETDSERKNKSMLLSFEISEIQTDARSKNDCPGPQRPTAHLNMIGVHDAEIRDDIEDQSDQSTMDPSTDAETEARDVKSERQNSKAGNEGFTEMLDISEHSTSIEMRFDTQNREQSVDVQSREELSEGELSEGERLERDNAEAIYKSLQDFKKEYKKYVRDDKYTTNIVTNSFTRRKDPSVLGSGSKISKLSHAPQPHLNNSSNDEEDHSNRDDNSFSKAKTTFLSQQNRLFSTEIDDSSSKDVSERTTASERSRALRKKMSDLLEIKNNIKHRYGAQVTADTYHNEEVANQQQLQNETPATTANLRSGEAPWGLAADKNPKLYKFLKSKSSLENNRRGSTPVPFDENSKHTRESETVAPTNDTVAAHE